MGTGTLYAPGNNIKPFLSGSVGYQWSHGDFQRLRTYDSQWLWDVSGGVEIGMGFVTFTPRIGYTDSFENNSRSTWHYGGEVHHWFNERVGGYVDATFHDPRRNGGNNAPEAWTYLAGLRVKF
jgi:hypothetical protein